jgi:hypothetical protein
MNTEFTSNQFRLYHNSGLKLQEEIDLKVAEVLYLELVELIELFSYKESDEKILRMKIKKSEINKKYQPQIKEAKRILKNTVKRINYNYSRC